MLRAAILSTALALASCAPAGTTPQATRATVASVTDALPAPRRFAGPPRLNMPTPRNDQLARDFMALSFQLETGRALPVFTRFEGPITVALEGAPPATLSADLDDLIGRLRAEAGIDIARAKPGEMGSITVTALPRAQLQRYVPGAACFVVPRVAGWKDYLAKRLGPATDWTTLQTRDRASVFLPADVSPQEIRDCLHEEIAQALGPLNDLYRLPWSVFNDDNTHVVLTPFDMLILRATYDPALRSGIGQDEVARRIPEILARINPGGRRTGPRVVESSGDWVEAVRGALNPRGSDRARVARAKDAVAFARHAGWSDERLAFSYLALGRATLASDTESAIAAFLEAGSRYRALTGDSIHSAQVALQLGAFALSSGQTDAALSLLDGAIPAADGAQNASLLATLLLLRAEATEMQGARAEAARIRREGLAWGRYAWGDEMLAMRAGEVAGLGPGA
ncbi:DUF2927 domain-containing protein [Jannaschia ovalis]|uniref:DUF2927 domain-containing protein n=1 Tax=Jannaschia ovalis TaxID=3038773 RepID=A0ABY8L9E9_9RHOB|nr:DUF2927 domain-containing protein [Jannaschia sp. GRR-S6-38]WGH77979.1 DUF2927 domain-containing protein [Jannaschia sp. GRR-S6-38]